MDRKKKWVTLLLMLVVFLLPVRVQAAKKTITFMNGKKVVSQVKAAKGKKLTVEALPDTSKATFLGWSRTAGQTVAPEIEAGQYFEVQKKMTLYAVYYKRAQEPDIAPANVTDLDTESYKELILVGDSRYVRTKKAMGSKVCKKKNLIFFSVSGRELDEFIGFMNEYNESDLLDRVKKDNEKMGRPIAIVFNLGINDLRLVTKGRASSVAKRYLSYLKSLAKKLNKYNVSLFYQSVDPLGGATKGRYPAAVRVFNEKMKDGCLAAGWKFLDTYSWMMKNGFSSNSTSDGVHYSERTSKRVLDILIQMVNLMGRTSEPEPPEPVDPQPVDPEPVTPEKPEDSEGSVTFYAG